MPPDLLPRVTQVLTVTVFPLAWKILGAVALWVIGGWIINTISNLTQRGMAARRIEPTLMRYADSALKVALRIALVTFMLSVFGVETTSVAAFVGAAGIAIGAAWAGLLSNFAAGVFLILLRPFKVGDMIAAGGVTGVVTEIGLFATTLDQADDVRTFVGNSKIFADNIINYNANTSRRVELTAQIAHAVDPLDAIARLKAHVGAVPNVDPKKGVDVEILEFNAAGTKLAVRPHTHNDHYWQVFFDTNKAILAAGGEAKWPIPAPQQVMINRNG
jgi:small conductance mechanosensitive channel